MKEPGIRTRQGGRDGLVGSNPSRAGDHNQRLVLHTISSRGSATCGDIAAAAGLTHQAAINIVKRLHGDGLVAEDGKISGLRGQPSKRYVIHADGAYALGLNIDRDHVTLVAIDLMGKVRFRVTRHMQFPLPGDVLDFLRTQTNTLFGEGVVPRERVVGLGISIPDGLFVVPVASRPEAFDQWSGADINAACADLLGLPVFSCNDATCAAIGEHQLGHGANHASFIYVLISAGLGCGVIIDGKPYVHGKNHAGEIGNIPIADAGGKRRILWDVVSIYALYAELARHGVMVDSPDAIARDDPATSAGIDAWIDQAVIHMMTPFLTINYIISPEISYIGGQLPPFIVEKLCVRLNERINSFETHTPITQFLPSTTATDASALGAAVLAFRNRLLP